MSGQTDFLITCSSFGTARLLFKSVCALALCTWMYGASAIVVTAHAQEAQTPATSAVKSSRRSQAPAPAVSGANSAQRKIDPKIRDMLTQLNNWSRFYYLSPDPARTPAMVALMNGTGLLERPEAAGWIVGLLSGIWSRSPEVTSTSVGKLDDYPVNARRVLAQALWFANTSQSMAILKAQDNDRLVQLLGADIFATAAPTMKNLPIRHSFSVDVLWGHFFATGDVEDVRRFYPMLLSYEQARIVAQKPDATNEQKKQFQEQIRMGAAVANPLIANAVVHDAVLQELEQQAKQSKSPLAIVLAQIVTQAKKERAELSAAASAAKAK